MGNSSPEGMFVSTPAPSIDSTLSAEIRTLAGSKRNSIASSFSFPGLLGYG
jgi:hypothetical protein